jgi:hypothetical protein
MVGQGTFREGSVLQLKWLQLVVPPLCERQAGHTVIITPSDQPGRQTGADVIEAFSVEGLLIDVRELANVIDWLRDNVGVPLIRPQAAA